MPEDKFFDILQRLQERLAVVNAERDKLITAIEVIGFAVPGSSDEPTPAESSIEVEPNLPARTYGSGQLLQVKQSLAIRPDTYFGMSHHQAARQYLKDLGHADRIDSILKAITSGGVEVGGVNPSETLRAMLTKNSAFYVRVGPNTFGLREFYPHLQQKDGSPRRARPVRTKPKRRIVRSTARRRALLPAAEGPSHGNGT